MKKEQDRERFERERIVCRVKASSGCYDARLSADIYDGDGMDGDGTYDGETVICDACYIAIGMPVVGPGGDPGTLAGGRGRGGGDR